MTHKTITDAFGSTYSVSIYDHERDQYPNDKPNPSYWAHYFEEDADAIHGRRFNMSGQGGPDRFEFRKD